MKNWEIAWKLDNCCSPFDNLSCHTKSGAEQVGHAADIVRGANRIQFDFAGTLLQKVPEAADSKFRNWYEG